MGTDLPARIGALLEEYRSIRAWIEDLQVVAISRPATVRAPDRSVTLTVEPSGRLRELRIDAQVAAALGTTALAGRILTTSALATAQARAQLRSALRRSLPESLRDLVGPDGSVDLASLLPGQLEKALRADRR
jgi:hypothetical protein